MLKRSFALCIMLALFIALPVSAQGAPPSINAAIADLSSRVGVQLTVNDLENWLWSQAGYSAACPDATVRTDLSGYQFLLTYGGQIYDYRVTEDGQLVVLCSITGSTEEPPTPELIDPEDPPYSNPLCPSPVASITYPQTRLVADIQARVAPGLPNNLRTEPSTSAAAVGEIPGGAIFTVIAGPDCDDEGRLWWQVDFDGLVGWTAEYSGGTYLLEPVPGAGFPSLEAPVSAENAAMLIEVSRMEANLGSRMAFAPSPDVEGQPPATKLVVPGGTGNEAAMIYDINAPGTIPRSVPGKSLLTQIAFGSDPTIAVFGDAQGAVRFWDIRPGAPLVERAFLQGHDSPVSALAFDPSGATLASSGGRAFLTPVEGLSNDNAIVLWDVSTVTSVGSLRGHTGEVTTIAFGPPGSLVSGGQEGVLRIWDTATETSTIVVDVETSINALIYYDNQASIALALANGNILLLDAQTGEPHTTLAAHDLAVNQLALSPDATLMASAGEDGLVHVWDIATLSEDAEPLVSLMEHEGAVLDVAFSPDGYWLLSLGEDHSIRVWQVISWVG